jgi:hypothetical protein
MALAQSMKTLVNDLKRQRKARHDFVNGNREIVRQISQENRAHLKQIHDRNRELADQTKQILAASRDARIADFKATMTSIRDDIKRIHESKEAIVQGARGMIDEFRQDHQAAQAYWAEVGNDRLLEDDNEAKEFPSENVQKENTSPTVSRPKKNEVTPKKDAVQSVSTKAQDDDKQDDESKDMTSKDKQAI